MVGSRLVQTFRNSTSRPQFINLELATARFRLDPGEELQLRHSSDSRPYDAGSVLAVEFIDEGGWTELVVWTVEDCLFHPDGRPAEQDFKPAGGGAARMGNQA